MEMAWWQELGPEWWVPVSLTVAGVVLALLQWLGITPMTAATWFAPIFVWSGLVSLAYVGFRWNPLLTGLVSVAVIVGLLLYGWFWRDPPFVTASATPPSPMTASQPVLTGAATSLTALQLMDLMAADTPSTIALAQSQVGLSLQVQGAFHTVRMIPEGPTDEIWDTRPSQLAGRFMIPLEYFEESPTFPKRVVYVYVMPGQEEETAAIPARTEVVARGMIESIRPKSINIKDATILAIQEPPPFMKKGENRGP